ELIAGPEIVGGTEAVLFADTKADGVVGVFDDQTFFDYFDQLVIEVVFKNRFELAAFTTGFADSIAACIVVKFTVALHVQAIAARSFSGFAFLLTEQVSGGVEDKVFI